MPDDESKELLPCPFCGCAKVENWASRPPNKDADVWCVFCHQCLCEGPETATKDEAARQWNTRTRSPEEARAKAEKIADGLLEHFEITSSAADGGAVRLYQRIVDRITTALSEV